MQSLTIVMSAKYNDGAQLYFSTFRPSQNYLSGENKSNYNNVCHVTFSAGESVCGFKTFYLNFTLITNGWELNLFANCYWPTQFVNFNAKTHAFQNGDWVRVLPIVPVQGG